VLEQVVISDRAYDREADARPDCFKFRPGVYRSLRRGPEQFMTDLYDEWWTQRLAIEESARRGGEILITGLGLGLVVESIFRLPGSPVRHATIVEQSADVISLVAPHLQAKYPGRIEVVHADAFAWTPPTGRRFSIGWHDIWPNPWASECADEMGYLESRYRPWCDWQGSWAREYVAATRT
jgi:hypothetical protein